MPKVVLRISPLKRLHPTNDIVGPACSLAIGGIRKAFSQCGSIRQQLANILWRERFTLAKFGRLHRW